MSRLSEFLGRTGIANVAEKFPVRRGPSGPSSEPLDEESFEALGASIGEENEGLRSRLIEASRKIEELGSLRETFSGIVETLRELEQEKSHNVSLRNLLAETRAAYEKLRSDHQQSERKRVAAEGENERLREDLELSQQNAHALEASRSELSSENESRRGQIANLERQLAAETAQRQSLAEDNRAFGEQIASADRKIVQLEADTQSVRANLALSEDEKSSLQKSLDQSVADGSRLSRRLAENDNQLAAARARISQLESALNEVETERSRLLNQIEETVERHQNETGTLSTRLESLQSRAATAEKLLTDARQSLMARTEEVREFDRKAMEASIGRNSAEKKARQLEAAHEALERQVVDLTQSRATLVERSGLVTKTLKARETALARAEQKIAQLTERVAALEADNEASRSAEEKRLDELNSALSRERMERALAEGALEGSRKDFARVQRELSTHGGLPRPKGPRPVANPAGLKAALPPDSELTEPPTEPRGKNGKRPAATVEPIVKS